jgi:hypothetical protein
MSDRSKSEEHLRALELKLGHEVNDKFILYLDTKYWILLRDAYIGRSQDPIHAKLLRVIYNKTKSGHIICPGHLPICIEFAKQNDYQTLQKSFEILDLFSNGYCLKSPEDRLTLELFHFFRTKTLNEEDCYHPRILAWTKPFHFSGTQLPHLPLLDKDTNTSIQIQFLDYSWNLKFSDILKTIGCSEFHKNISAINFCPSKSLNEGKLSHADELRSLKQSISTETNGIIDILAPTIERLSEWILPLNDTKYYFKDSQNTNTTTIMINMIHDHLKTQPIDTKLATIRIQSMLHAAIRWDKQRKYRDNDMFDIEHASGALPYCDMFLTENSLYSLVTRKDIKLDSLYKCKVLADPKLAYEALEELSR